MLGKRQYSIRFLLSEMLLLAAALALIRQGLLWGQIKGLFCFLAALLIISGAVGWFFGNATIGIWFSLAGLVVVCLWKLWMLDILA